MADLAKRVARWAEPNSGKILQTVLLTDGPVPEGSAVIITQFAHFDWRMRKMVNGRLGPWLGPYATYGAAENDALALQWRSPAAGDAASRLPNELSGSRPSFPRLS